MRRTACSQVALAGAFLLAGSFPCVQPPWAAGQAPVPAPGSACVLHGPTLSESPAAPALAPVPPEPTDKPLPINLATALRLAGGRPLVIAAAQATVRVAAAELERARVSWLPNFYLGAAYFRHDGGAQGTSSNFYINSREQFQVGGGPALVLDASDAIFAPLAARQVLRSRQIDVEVARNDALLLVAEAYFNVQQARGRLAGIQDVLDKSRILGEKIRTPGVAEPSDRARARTELAEAEDSLATAREQWRIASADLTQVLRLDPSAVVVPYEPPHLRVTLIAPTEAVDTLIPIGLTYRPELASQQALVQAALARIRQERIRPLVPSLILHGASQAGPGDFFMYGLFGSGAHGEGNPWVTRGDVALELVWGVDNLGFGNRARVRERRAEQERVLVELFRIQDLVAAEVARAHAQLVSAATRVDWAEAGLREARLAYDASIAELGKVKEVEGGRVLIRRVFEVVRALEALQGAYERYFTSVNGYNRAEFRLYRAIGYPAGVLACERSPEPIVPVNGARPPPLPPVCAPDPCPVPH
jgi:outer membrane protein TolC